MSTNITLLSGVCDQPLLTRVPVATAIVWCLTHLKALAKVDVFEGEVECATGIRADEWLLRMDALGLVMTEPNSACAHLHTVAQEWPRSHLFCKDCESVVFDYAPRNATPVWPV